MTHSKHVGMCISDRKSVGQMLRTKIKKNISCFYAFIAPFLGTETDSSRNRREMKDLIKKEHTVMLFIKIMIYSVQLH